MGWWRGGNGGMYLLDDGSTWELSFPLETEESAHPFLLSRVQYVRVVITLDSTNANPWAKPYLLISAGSLDVASL